MSKLILLLTYSGGNNFILLLISKYQLNYRDPRDTVKSSLSVGDLCLCLPMVHVNQRIYIPTTYIYKYMFNFYLRNRTINDQILQNFPIFQVIPGDKPSTFFCVSFDEV